jgi:hypothetical protein
MRARTPGFLGFQLNRKLGVSWPAISKTVEMLLGQVDLKEVLPDLSRNPS